MTTRVFVSHLEAAQVLVERFFRDRDCEVADCESCRDDLTVAISAELARVATDTRAAIERGAHAHPREQEAPNWTTHPADDGFVWGGGALNPREAASVGAEVARLRPGWRRLTIDLRGRAQYSCRRDDDECARGVVFWNDIDGGAWSANWTYTDHSELGAAMIAAEAVCPPNERFCDATRTAPGDGGSERP
jgi:hypothetical protein